VVILGNVAIRAENLSKRFLLGQKVRYKTLRDTLAHSVRGPVRRFRSIFHGVGGDSTEESQKDYIWALKNVSFKISHGEAVGIIGRNGAGKSTLLKIISRITAPTSGWAKIHGRVGSLLEVGTGFHPELTGRENIFLNGAILGMRKHEIINKFDAIVAFAELEKFIDTPVKYYSSGMYIRLAFAVAAHLETEILLIDEVLAVGDLAFQKKCLAKMGDVAMAGQTVLFVSHSMGAISQLCSTCIWVNGGTIEAVGPTRSVVLAYIRSNSALDGTAQAAFDENPRKEAQLRCVKLLNEERIITQKFDCDRAIFIELLVQVHKSLPNLYGYLEISKLDGTRVLVSDSLDVVPNSLDNLPVGVYKVNITIPARTLGPGEYTLYLNFTSLAGTNYNVDSPGVVCSFSLDDMTSRRGNDRAGHFSLLLPWDVSPSFGVL
jgi:lipopolysaccharide transport system ATP-binding protein